MASCININHPDVIALSRELNLPAIVVAAKIQVWQDSNNSQEFPDSSQLANTLVKKDTVSVSNIYSKLGNKTKEGNVIIQSVYQTAGVQYAKSIGGIFSLRVNGTNNQFGNPFSSVESEIQKGLIRTKSTKESVEKYIEWILSPTTTIKPEQHKFIREWLQSGKLKNKPVVYYKELGEPSHATALDYLINKYDWGKKQDAQNQSNINYQNSNDEGIIASEKTIRDLAARLADRIGMPYKIESDRSKEYKGKIEDGVAYINLAYATLDSPIHEILGHPIIRAIKNKNDIEFNKDNFIDWVQKNKDRYKPDFAFMKGVMSEDEYNEAFKEHGKEWNKLNSEYLKNFSSLYQNLLKELEYGRGKEVLDRIKRDYVYKYNNLRHDFEDWGINKITDLIGAKVTSDNLFGSKRYFIQINDTNTRLSTFLNENLFTKDEFIITENDLKTKYTLEEQQEEAIVELLGMMTADRLDKVKDGKLISLLKRLLKEIKSLIKELLFKREVEIDKLPDNLVLKDLADLLAYSNSKLILPGYEVEYTTPDNMKFKTYQEASNHIGKLARDVKDVDLNKVKIEKKSIIGKIDPITGKKVKSAKFIEGDPATFLADENQWEPPSPDKFHLEFEDGSKHDIYQDELYGNSQEILDFYLQIVPLKNTLLYHFIEKNKEYEQSKEIIDEWKKINNIQYNPEEVYSRGQEFSSVVGAYSSFDVDLMMQNLLQHIEDNEKAGGQFAISAYTKPIDKTIGHLEGGGGKIKFKIYPQSKDILWAANTDVYSGSVWDASEKVNKDKKSELLGVSYTKYPALKNIDVVQPNLASIIDNLAHHHNELGIALTGNNFRLEYDEDIPYQTKKIIDGINRILDHRYGKLVTPKITKNNRVSSGIQPTQTKDNIKESIISVKTKLDTRATVIPDKFVLKSQYTGYANDTWFYKQNGNWFMKNVPYDAPFNTKVEDYDITNMTDVGLGIDEVWESYLKTNSEELENLQVKEKEYTNQALINTKIAALKEVAKKYPRSLIRSEVKLSSTRPNTALPFEPDELPFQKIPNLSSDPLGNIDTTPTKNLSEVETKLLNLLTKAGLKLSTLDDYAKESNLNLRDVNALVDFTKKVVALGNGYTVEQLGEEVAHIAVMNSEGTTEFQKAYDLVEQSPFFSEYETYKERYKKDFNLDDKVADRKARIEILGKQLNQVLKNKLAPIRVDTWLMRLWRKFLNLFKTKELTDYLENITDTFLQEPTLNVVRDEIYYSLQDEENYLKGQISSLKERQKALRKRNNIPEDAIKSVDKQIKSLAEELEGNVNGLGIYKFLGFLNNDLNSAFKWLENYFDVKKSSHGMYLGDRNSTAITNNDLVTQLAAFIGYYRPFLEELKSIIGQDSIIGSARKMVLDKLITNHKNRFDVIQQAYAQLVYEDGVGEVGDGLRKEFPDLTDEEIQAKIGWDWKKGLKFFYKDSNFLETWFAPIRNNTDTLNRIVHKLVFDLNNAIRRTTMAWADSFMTGVEDFIGKDMSWVYEYHNYVEQDKKTGKVRTVRKKTGYWLHRLHYTQWEQNKKEFYQNLNTQYRFSQDFTERAKEQKLIQSYKLLMTDPGLDAATRTFYAKELERLKSYNRAIDNWNKYNTKVVDNAQEIINLRKIHLSPNQFSLWWSLNTATNEDGSIKYFKGELVSPSDGSEVKRGKEKFTTIDYTNKDYAKLTARQQEVLEYLKKEKRKIDFTLPEANIRLAPQTYESMLDAMFNKDPDLYKRLKANVGGAITRKEDDTEFNNEIKLNDGTLLEQAPLRFISKLKDPSRISSDILSSMVAYKQMATNYIEKSKKLSTFENILQLSKTRRLVGKEQKSGESTWSYTALKNFLDVHISGKERDDYTVEILGNDVNVSKLVDRLSGWVRSKNLGLNFITMTSNLISTKVFATIESLIGKYTTVKSSAFANKEFFSMLPSILNSHEKYRSTDRISTLMRFFGLGEDMRNLFNDLDKHVLMRNQPDKTLMYGYQAGDYFSKAIVMISVLDNFRMHEGKFYTAKEAQRAGLDFDKMVSAYSMINTADGTAIHSMSQSVIDNLTSRIKTITSQVDGALSPEDKAAIYQHSVFAMVGLHRGWLFEGMSRRLKTKGYDFTLQDMTEGMYRTAGTFAYQSAISLVGKYFMPKEKISQIKSLLANWNELEDYQKENLKRVVLELLMISAFTVIALALNSGDDDEDDLFMDLLAYQSNRALLEVSSFYNPTELINAIKDPIVPARDLELITNFTELFSGELIESGKYEGLSKREKFLLQLIPGIKGYTLFQDPKGANNFLKHKQLSPLYNLEDLYVDKNK